MSHYHMQDCLLQSQRNSGTRKPITIIDPAKYQEFFGRLKFDYNMDLEFKTFLAVSLSGGLRVSECLSIGRKDVDLDAGFFRVLVLKKKKRIKGVNGSLNVNKVYRECKLHPVAVELLKEYLTNTRAKYFTGKIFTFCRKTAHVKTKEYFGPDACVHSMARHSHISWLLHEKNQSQLAVARIMEMSVPVVASYNHVNRKKRLNELYEEA